MAAGAGGAVELMAARHREAARVIVAETEGGGLCQEAVDLIELQERAASLRAENEALRQEVPRPFLQPSKHT